MSLLQPISCQDQDSGEQFARSMHEIGFAVLKDHGIDLKLLHQAYQYGKTFLKVMKSLIIRLIRKIIQVIFKGKIRDSKRQYSKRHQRIFSFYPKLNYCPEHLAVPTRELVDELLVLARRCLAWAQEYAPAKVQQGFSIPLIDMIERGEFNLFRPIHYPPITGDEPVGAVRAASHTDINLLTLLFPSSAKGLQVKHKNGQWLDVPTDKDWLVINVGDMLDECSVVIIHQRFIASLTRMVRRQKSLEFPCHFSCMPMAMWFYLNDIQLTLIEWSDL